MWTIREMTFICQVNAITVCMRVVEESPCVGFKWENVKFMAKDEPQQPYPAYVRPFARRSALLDDGSKDAGVGARFGHATWAALAG